MVVARSATSSTTPSSFHGSTVMVSPTENQPSNSITAPVRTSVRNRWAAKPTISTSSEAPAIAVTAVPVVTCAAMYRPATTTAT